MKSVAKAMKTLNSIPHVPSAFDASSPANVEQLVLPMKRNDRHDGGC